MPGLLVSVRSASEARAALAGGASHIDLKEPDRGPLGRADERAWREVRDVVPRAIPVSVALGELHEWTELPALPPSAFDGIAFRKLGLANATCNWAARWRDVQAQWEPVPAWIAVVYADWRRACAPHPEAVLAFAIEQRCTGLLIDTWDKSQTTPLDLSWTGFVGRARAAHLTVAIAGGLDERAIERLQPLRPDLFAVRGAACSAGERRGEIDPARVARLVRAANGDLPAIRGNHAAAVAPAAASEASTASAAS